MPRSGLALEHERLHETYTNVVVIRPRRWTYRLVYRIRGEELRVEHIDPGWKPRELP